MKKFKPFGKNSLLGALIGVINGFFGAGGGLVCVPLMIKMGMERKIAHANAVAVIFPITLISAVSYILQGRVEIAESIIFLPAGLVGSLCGTFIMKKISPEFIRKIFGGFMIWAGWRLIFG